MKKPYLLTDVDGVLLDWIKSFGLYVQSRGYKLNFPTPKTWEMTEWFGGDHKTIVKLITEFNSSPAFAEIPVLEDARRVLPILAEKYRLVAITCCSTDKKTISRRKSNLKLLGVSFEEVHCLNFTDSKSDLLKSYDPSIWVEDRIEGAESGFNAGHQSFLRGATYNQNHNHEGVIRVSSWDEISKLIKS